MICSFTHASIFSTAISISMCCTGSLQQIQSIVYIGFGNSDFPVTHRGKVPSVLQLLHRELYVFVACSAKS